jgi:hypothetical protein
MPARPAWGARAYPNRALRNTAGAVAENLRLSWGAVAQARITRGSRMLIGVRVGRLSGAPQATPAALAGHLRVAGNG